MQKIISMAKRTFQFLTYIFIQGYIKVLNLNNEIKNILNSVTFLYVSLILKKGSATAL